MSCPSEMCFSVVVGLKGLTIILMDCALEFAARSFQYPPEGRLRASQVFQTVRSLREQVSGNDNDYEMEFGIGELQTIRGAVKWSLTRIVEFTERVGVCDELGEKFHAAVRVVCQELDAMIESCVAIFASAIEDDLTEIPII